MAVDALVVLTPLTASALVMACGSVEWSVELEVPSVAVQAGFRAAVAPAVAVPMRPLDTDLRAIPAVPTDRFNTTVASDLTARHSANVELQGEQTLRPAPARESDSEILSAHVFRSAATPAVL
jgi:hypothetical protein